MRLPIQESFVADELKLTREQETAQSEALLREAEQKVFLETKRVKVDTEKMVAKALAEGSKTARETEAETIKLSAAIDRKTAEIDAQAVIELGKANADAERMIQESRSQKFELAVAAFGSGQAYNQWVFAEGLPDDIELKMLYAGEGTFWTELKGFTDVMLGRQAVQQQQAQQQREK